MSISGKGIELRPYTAKQLSELYGVDVKTFRSWLKPFANEIGEKKGYFYNIVQVRCIFNHLGLPGNFITD